MNALLELRDVSVALGGKSVVESISLSVAAGEIIALLGPNGAGKTSLIRAALGLIATERGAVRLGESDPAQLAPRLRATRAAYLPQRPQAIWPVSVEHLVALGRFAYGAAPDRLRRPDQLAVDAALRCCRLDSLRARRMDEISGGEKARAHLARALAQGAPLLLLDEPTAGLDPAQALGVGDILGAHAANGGGALFSTHDVSLAARIAHRVLVLREGRLVAAGAVAEALTPATLEAAYGRRASIDRLGGHLSVIFQ
ncbi:MAG TPA: ABC transporter ATP-binding protein [Caulobacterales bacterium]|nr:ABC transporter ATP-binding protein [Caulobacterales bacterium]